MNNSDQDDSSLESRVTSTEPTETLSPTPTTDATPAKRKPRGKPLVRKTPRAWCGNFPEFVTGNGQEYVIEAQGSMWKIRRKVRGVTPGKLTTLYMKRSEAVRALTEYMKRRDTFRRAIYPGCPERNRTRFTTYFSRDLLPKPPS